MLATLGVSIGEKLAIFADPVVLSLVLLGVVVNLLIIPDRGAAMEPAR